MSLLLVISTVWVTVLALTLALLRMAALADADDERHAREQQRRRAGDRLHEHAPARARMDRLGEHSIAGR